MTSDVFNQDCIEYMRTLPDGFFHLAVADPPYGQADKESGWGGGRFGGPKTARFYKYRKQDADNDLAVSWDTAPDADFFRELARVSQHQIIWGANFFPQMPPCKCFITWVKTNIPDGFRMAQAEYAWTSLTCNARVWHGSSARTKDGTDHFHPTEKPVALYSWLMETWLESVQKKPADGLKVFDPMMGSQSSRIAAYGLGIDYYGCELDAEYFRRGCERYERKTAGKITLPDGRKVQQLNLF